MPETQQDAVVVPRRAFLSAVASHLWMVYTLGFLAPPFWRTLMVTFLEDGCLLFCLEYPRL